MIKVILYVLVLWLLVFCSCAPAKHSGSVEYISYDFAGVRVQGTKRVLVFLENDLVKMSLNVDSPYKRTVFLYRDSSNIWTTSDGHKYEIFTEGRYVSISEIGSDGSLGFVKAR